MGDSMSDRVTIHSATPTEQFTLVSRLIDIQLQLNRMESKIDELDRLARQQ